MKINFNSLVENASNIINKTLGEPFLVQFKNDDFNILTGIYGEKLFTPLENSIASITDYLCTVSVKSKDEFDRTEVNFVKIKEKKYSVVAQETLQGFIKYYLGEYHDSSSNKKINKRRDF